MIVVVDYGMGNLHSVSKALSASGVQVCVTDDPEVVAQAERLVVPGVGAFADAMKRLTERDLCEPIREHIHSGKPFLGICLGLQLLFEVGCEDGDHPGLGVFPGKVVRFELDDATLKVPHMGWNRARIVSDTPCLSGLTDEDYVYFVHSYYVKPADEGIVATWTDYGGEFVSSVARENLFACQFHPEKSQSLGLRILKNFVNL